MHSEDGAEDMRHGSITEWIDGNYVEMSKEARRYFLTTATRRTHGPPKLNVFGAPSSHRHDHALWRDNQKA